MAHNLDQLSYWYVTKEGETTSEHVPIQGIDTSFEVLIPFPSPTLLVGLNMPVNGKILSSCNPLPPG